MTAPDGHLESDYEDKNGGLVDPDPYGEEYYYYGDDPTEFRGDRL